MNRDPIPAIEKLGYTLREASFLYLVAAHSGYFLRRQFAQFIDRVDGAMATHFLRKAESYAHVHTLVFGQNRHIHHLTSKNIYRLLGNEDSQNRRIKGNEEIQRRLMMLDYVLDHPQETFLASEREKVQFFHEILGIPVVALPQVAFASSSGHTQTVRYFVDRLPISFLHQDQERPQVRMAYVDIGTATIKPFLRFLDTHQSLLDALPDFSLIYVADSTINFPSAEQQFRRRSGESVGAGKFPLGIGHFLSYLKARQTWERNEAALPFAQLALLQEGGQLYRLPAHEVIYAQWKSGAVKEQALWAEFSPSLGSNHFEVYLLKNTYPFRSFRYAGRQ
ncbi:MAG: hypothetical protein ACYCOR_17525 [Acidobacteriaceae bacterium]